MPETEQSLTHETPSRQSMLSRIADGETFDLLVIGGGATGLGVALDAVTRGLSVALVEANDFAKGTSSRATKLVHGGVRYLAQGNITLVREALHERTNLLNNAPHLAQPLEFITPVYGAKGLLFDKPFYGTGLMIYEHLAAGSKIGPTRLLSRAKTMRDLPGVQTHRLSGGIGYWDGQFDDARLAVTLARTTISRGGCVLNHCAVTKLEHDAGKVVGACVTDNIGKRELRISAACVINATGVWVDTIRRMDNTTSSDMVAPSQGVHLVVDREFLPSNRALLIPKTSDGRVLFAVPWLGKVILGTTDTPRKDLASEPAPFAEEVGFILNESANYLANAPSRSDVRSVWVGLRPLVKPSEEEISTKSLSREHTVRVGKSGMVTVTGGKWTTYRSMAEDVLQQCIEHKLLNSQAEACTKSLRLIASPETALNALADTPSEASYGLEANIVANLEGASNTLAAGLSEAMVRFAVRYEYACTVEDVLARRSRLLFLDARKAEQLAESVSYIMSSELGDSFNPVQSALEFSQLARRYASLP